MSFLAGARMNGYLDPTRIRHRNTWPGGKRCVAAITVDLDGDSVEVGRGQTPLGTYSHGRYAAKCGVPRFLRLGDELGIGMTFFVPGYDAEKHPDLVREIAASGHEVAAHGYLHEGWDPGDAEPELLRRTHTILSDLLPQPPRGWRSPGGSKSERTMRTLLELGYVYDSSDKDFDLPFVAHAPKESSRRLLVLPNNVSSLDDFPFYRVSYAPPSAVLRHWIEEWEAIRQENGFFNLTVHPRTGYGSGSPARANVVRDLVRHMQASGDVGFVTLGELADWCLANAADWQRPELPGQEAGHG